MNYEIIKQITIEIDSAFSPGKAVTDASTRPDPEQLYLELWYEGEVCCLFADSNLGKSIFAVQMADQIARTRNVLYVDCELSDKQFQLRYCNPDSGERHLFPESLYRAEINPYSIGAEGYEQHIIDDIETASPATQLPDHHH